MMKYKEVLRATLKGAKSSWKEWNMGWNMAPLFGSLSCFRPYNLCGCETQFIGRHVFNYILALMPIRFKGSFVILGHRRTNHCFFCVCATATTEHVNCFSFVNSHIHVSVFQWVGSQLGYILFSFERAV